MTLPNPVLLAIMTTLFLALGYLGVPVAFALIAGVLVGTLFTPITLQSMIAQLFNGVDSEALMAIPFFLLVGELMTSANVVIRIAELSQALVGHIRGGLAQVTTVFSMFFSGMSGSSSADVAVLSRTMARPMAREGYRPEFTAALSRRNGPVELDPLDDGQESRAHDRAFQQATARQGRWRRWWGDGVG